MIKTTQSLKKKDIRDLIEENILILQVKNFFSIQQSEELAKIISTDPTRTPYTHEIFENGKYIQKTFGVDRVGVPFNSTYNHDEQSTQSYQNHKEYFLTLTRKNNLKVIDKLFHSLNSIYGAIRPKIKNKELALGIGRIGLASNNTLYKNPHIDKPPKNLLDIEKQFGANIYLQMPKEGGHIEIWNKNINKSTIKRSELGSPIIIQPEVGDLILINTRKPHAVTPHQTGERISASCFVGYIKKQPLHLWS